MRTCGAGRLLGDLSGHLGTFAAYGGGAILAALLVSQYFAVLIWIPVAAVLLALGSSLLVVSSRRQTQ